MKVYPYTPADCGRPSFPPGELRLAGAEPVGPAEADVFVLPAIIRCFTREQLYALPYLPGNETRHVFWNCAEDLDLWFDLPSLFLRCDATTTMQQHDPNTHGWPWPVEDLWREHTGFDYDVVFQGWESTPLTRVVCESVVSAGLSTHILCLPYFFGYHDSDPAYAHLKESFKNTLARGRLSLVPRSLPGVVRYRFYQALSMGRVPVLLCDDALLPWREQIDYDRCSIRIAEKDAEHTGEILRSWLSNHKDDEIQAMGAYGRSAWARYLNRDHWSERFAEAVELWVTR